MACIGPLSSTTRNTTSPCWAALSAGGSATALRGAHAKFTGSGAAIGTYEDATHLRRIERAYL